MLNIRFKIQKFKKNTKGTLFIVFALGLIALVGAGALALDFTNSLTTSARLQEYLDTATLNTSLVPDLTTDNVNDYGNKYLTQVLPYYLGFESATFTLENNQFVHGTATARVKGLLSRIFNIDNYLVERHSTVTIGLSNLDIHIFLDTSLTMVLPATPVDPLDVVISSAGTDSAPYYPYCIFTCHDNGSLTRSKGFSLKTDVAVEGIQSLITDIENSGGKNITYTFYRYKDAAIDDPEMHNEIFRKDGEWKDPYNVRLTIPMVTPIAMTSDPQELRDYFSVPLSMSGGTDLNDSLKTIYSTLQWRDDVYKWYQSDPANNDPSNVSAVLSNIPDRSAENRLFQEVKNNERSNASQILKNMTLPKGRTIVIFISDGDHRRAISPFDPSNCDNIKNMKDTELYTLLVKSDEEFHKFPDFHTTEENFTGGIAQANDPALSTKPIEIEAQAKIAGYKIPGLSQYGYTVGLYNAPTLMKNCATDNKHFYQGEFRDDLLAAFDALKKDIKVRIPRIINND